MAKALFIIAQKNFRDEELEEPLMVLKKAGHQCEIASIEDDVCTGMLGAKVKPNLAVRDANADDYDVVVVVGGSGSPELAKHSDVLMLLRKAKELNKKLAAICLGPMILAKAGVIKDKNVTVYKTDESVNAVREAGANLIDKAVVVDKDLVTANGPKAAEKFGKKILEML